MPECQDSGEPVLVALAQNGDQEAMEALLRRSYRPLRGFITPMVGASHADDVLQEIALAIFQNLRYLRHPRAFRSWAFRLASRRAFRHLKRETRWARLETDPDAISSVPAPETLPEALEAGLLAAIEQVSPASRAVLLLHYCRSVGPDAAALDLRDSTLLGELAVFRTDAVLGSLDFADPRSVLRAVAGGSYRLPVGNGVRCTANTATPVLARPPS